MVGHGERPTSSQHVDMPPENSPTLSLPISVDMHTSQDEMSPPVTPRTLDENETATKSGELYGNLKAEIWKEFIYVPSPHTSEVLCEALTGCLLDWSLNRKLSTITLDNCSTNDAMMRLLLEKLPSNSLLCGGKLLHMRCAAHILNLVVQDGLRVIGKTIEKVRDNVSYWTATPKRTEKFEESARQLRVELGTEYPTANLYFPKICEIKLALNNWISCGIGEVESMAIEMLAKFNNYWSDVHGIMGVVTVLDPRYKCVLLEYYFPMIYGTNGEFEVDENLDVCRELVQQYEAKEKRCSDRSGLLDPNFSNDPSLSGYDLYASQRKRKVTKSELDLYLDEDVLPRTPDFDVLSWWNSNKGKYPILHQIARDILGIPVSMVASDSAFSTSGRLISPHRSRLHPTTIEALMCSQSWMQCEQGNSL
ncbi:Zinc finger BED domain-containing protein DAYSLEEPER [Striga hermonthica]|uniref:Zinc finger BED domain-containing protein DAYSLEEPER n=1 Tax=Striga hermonthica TaxID=68872 RepID=A0A9N7R4U6_STRHE|nr:Zinc finger BED domain-containing protein DAYSLEEPER [Striga hermonthica]